MNLRTKYPLPEQHEDHGTKYDAIDDEDDGRILSKEGK
jgi:hypothetical protein